jgi:hypothetical protein
VDFSTTSIPSTNASAVLQQSSALSLHILPSVLPGERILVVCKFHFPYLKYFI